MAQLITMLRSCTSEAHRATEELRYLRDERALCKLYWRSEVQALQHTIAAMELRRAALLQPGALLEGGEIPACSSFGSSAPTTPVAAARESAYCQGLLMLLEGRLSICRQQLDAAERQFQRDDCDWEAAAVVLQPADSSDYGSSGEGPDSEEEGFGGGPGMMRAML